jgi:hypothetical protein
MPRKINDRIPAESCLNTRNARQKKSATLDAVPKREIAEAVSKSPARIIVSTPSRESDASRKTTKPKNRQQACELFHYRTE